MTLRTIIFARILMTALPLALVSVYLTYAWLNDSRDKAMSAVGNVAMAAASNVESHLSGAETVLGVLARRRAVESLDPASCDDAMTYARESNPALVNVSLFDATGRLVCALVVPADGKAPEMADRSWFKSVMAENRFVVSEPVQGRLTGILIVILAYPVRDERGGIVGAITLSHELSDAWSLLGYKDMPPDTRIKIVDRSGIVIANYPDAVWIGRNAADQMLVRAAQDNDRRTGVGTSIDGTDVVFASARILPVGWTVIASQPTASVFAAARAQGYSALSILAIVLAGSLAMAGYMAHRMLKLTTKVVGIARTIAEGRHDVRMPEPPYEEFAVIARHFNRMLDARADSERRIFKLNRMYAALSATNQAITQISNRIRLLGAVCRIAVEQGRFALVWIGFVDPKTSSVVPEAHAGAAAGYLDGLRISIDPREAAGLGPTALAIRDNRPQIVSDSGADPRISPWRGATADFGFKSSAAIPLTQDGRAVGSINLYSTEPDYFDDPELRSLIEQMASDLSFALDSMRREAERHETEERFRQIAESIREVFWLTDIEKNRILYINPAYRDIWGREADELYASPQSWLDAIHPEDRDRILLAAITKQTSGEYDEEYRIVRPDGKVRWIHDRAFPIHDANGQVYRIAGIADDITERKRMEETVRRGEATLAAAQELAGLGYWQRNFTTDVAYWSDTMYQLLNRDPALGVPSFEVFLDCIDPADRQAVRDATLQGLQTGQEIKFEFRSNTALGPVRQLRSTIVPVRNLQGEIVEQQGILLDITEIKDAEARLLQAQKMEALGNLAGGIAHDFNNMLLPILGLSELSKDDLPPDHPVQENLSLIVEAASRASDLVKQILAFGRRSDRTLTRIDIAACVVESLRLLRTTLPATIRFVERIDKESGVILADVAELNSVILNLGSNAAHAMDGANGTLIVDVSPVEMAAATRAQHPNLAADARFVRIEVTDTGHGMDEETAAKIFNPFFTTKPVGTGTGLGLAMVHGIVTGLGGAIDVESKLGVGTTFTIYLPLADTGTA